MTDEELRALLVRCARMLSEVADQEWGDEGPAIGFRLTDEIDALLDDLRAALPKEWLA